MAMDEDLDHAAVGEDRLEEGVVHGVSGMVGLQGGGGVGAKGWLDGRGGAGSTTASVNCGKQAGCKLHMTLCNVKMTPFPRPIAPPR